MKLTSKRIIGIVILLVLLAGVGIGVNLVQKQQTLKSKASGESFINAFELKDKNGNLIQCDGSTNPPVCATGTLDVNVRVKDINPLLPQ